MSVLSHTPGTHYLTEGGFETELMYLHGLSLPQFATFPLLREPAARKTMLDVYRRMLGVAAAHGMVPLFGSFDYRASPDWGALLGYDQPALSAAIADGIHALRGVIAECAEVPKGYVAGYIGPRGDAYSRGARITATEAEDYHAPQIAAQRAAGADLSWAVTFNNVPEAVGVVRAARSAGMPIAVSFTLNGTARLSTGPAVHDAISEVDAETGGGPEFYTLNCSHPDEFEPALVPGEWMHRVRGFRPNAVRMDKLALCKLGHLEDGDPVELGRQMGGLARRFPHLDIWGGCCGTDHRHAAEICRCLPVHRNSAATADVPAA